MAADSQVFSLAPSLSGFELLKACASPRQQHKLNHTASDTLQPVASAGRAWKSTAFQSYEHHYEHQSASCGFVEP